MTKENNVMIVFVVEMELCCFINFNVCLLLLLLLLLSLLTLDVFSHLPQDSHAYFFYAATWASLSILQPPGLLCIFFLRKEPCRQ